MKGLRAMRCNWWNLRLSPFRSSRNTKRAVSGISRATRLAVEHLEARLAPSFTVGNVINITKSAGDEAEDAIILNPTNSNNLFVTSTSGGTHKFSMDGGATWTDSNISGIPGSGGDEQMAWDTFGNLFMTYLGGNGVVVALSTDGGASFTKSLDVTASDQPSIAVGA